MGHYDLYGNSYPTAMEAMNAEMTQCNEIDNRLMNNKIRDLECQLQYRRPEPTDTDEQIHYLLETIKTLEARIVYLESQLPKKNK